MEAKIISFVERYYHTKRALFLGLVFIFLFIILPADGFFEKGVAAFYYRLILYATFEFIWIVAWFLWRLNFPACDASRLGVVICISTENEKQLNRIRTDFVKHLEDLFKQHKLNEITQVIVMNDYQLEFGTF